MKKLLWITLLTIGLLGCSEEDSQTDTQKSWCLELKDADPFVELVLLEMSVTTGYFKLKTN